MHASHETSREFMASNLGIWRSASLLIARDWDLYLKPSWFAKALPTCESVFAMVPVVKIQTLSNVLTVVT